MQFSSFRTVLKSKSESIFHLGDWALLFSVVPLTHLMITDYSCEQCMWS